MKISPFFTETTVSCSETEYACSSGRCIPARWQCDREQDCDDGSDESEDICGKLTFFWINETFFVCFLYTVDLKSNESQPNFLEQKWEFALD